MEYITITKDENKYGFKKGDRFMIKRNIMNECVVIIPDEHTPNVILSERQLRRYGTLEGTPQLCFH